MAYNGAGNGRGNPYGKKPNWQDGNRQEASLPKGYLAEGYYQLKEGEHILRKEYIVDYSREIAKSLELESNGKRNKRSQIRKFYEYVLRIQELLKRKNGDFAMVEAELARLVPFVKYAKSRDTISGLFEDFIEKNIQAIGNANDLTAFAKHFEAIIAYLPKDKN